MFFYSHYRWFQDLIQQPEHRRWQHQRSRRHIEHSIHRIDRQFDTLTINSAE